MAKKLLALALAVIMALGLIACNNNSTPVDTKDTTPSVTVPEDTKPHDPVVLEWYYRSAGVQKDTQLVEDKLNELLKETELDYVTLHIHPFNGSEYAQQVALAQASGAQMDIVGSVSLNFYQNIEDGTWMPMNDYMSDTLKDEFPDWLWDQCSVDGNVYIVPNYQNAFNCAYFVFPQEYMDKYGNYDEMKAILQDPNKTLTEKAACLEEYTMKVREGEGDTKYCNYLDMGSNSGSLGFSFVTPYDQIATDFIVFDGSDTVEYIYETDYWKEQFAIYADWASKGIFAANGVSSSRWDWKMENMMDETAFAWYCQALYGPEEFIAATVEGVCGCEIAAIKVQDYNFIQKNYAAGGNGISSTCQNPDVAAKFLELINCGDEMGKKIYNTLVFGLEGVHWEWVDEANDRIKTLEYDDSQGSECSYAAWKWCVGNSFYAYKNQAVQDDQYPIAKEMNESPDTVSSSLIGFVSDTTSIQTKLEQCNAVKSEYFNALYNGTMGPDGWEAYYNEFIEKMKTAGMDDIKAELQRQLDAFLASK